jgi:hypothetical protein
MFIRPDLDMTLGKATALLEKREEGAAPSRVPAEDIRIVLGKTKKAFVFGEEEVPVTEHGMAAFGDLLQIPSAFLNRIEGPVSLKTRESLMNEILKGTLHKDARVVSGPNGLVSIDEWGKDPVSPKDVIRVATNVLGEDAPIVRWIDTPAEFSFDAHVTEDHGQGYYADGVTAYADGNERDDITAGGLRFGVNLKRGLAPYTQEILHRLACTNGMTIERAGLKVDARGQTVDEVLAELEAMAQIAMGKVEEDIRHFYDMKKVAVDNPERALRTMARENKIPDRSTNALMDMVVTEEMPDEPTMFDLVNLVTNFANNPSMKNDGGRLILEAAGGAAITEHGKANRCGHCKQKVHA